MLKCEGYKMFCGTMTIAPKNGMPPFNIYGTWLYKPEYDCWYVNDSDRYPLGASFGSEICTIVFDEDQLE